MPARRAPLAAIGDHNQFRSAPWRDTLSPTRESPMPTTVEPAEIAAIAGANHGTPFDVLGQHLVTTAGGPAVAIRAFQPQAASVSVRRGEALHPMWPDAASPGCFE